jgi:hypothetical protein
MPIKFTIAHAEIGFEAGFDRPQFPLFREASSLLDRLFGVLEPYGARLSDIRWERGTGSIGDLHLMCYLFNYMVTVRVRVDKVEFNGSQMPVDHVEKYGAAIVDLVSAVRDSSDGLKYRAHALAVALHGSLDGTTTHDFLAKFTRNVPDGLGPSISSGTVMYFGPSAERLTSYLMIDSSGFVPNGLLFRCHATWDGAKVPIEKLPALGNELVSTALGAIGLERAS